MAKGGTKKTYRPSISIQWKEKCAGCLEKRFDVHERTPIYSQMAKPPCLPSYQELASQYRSPDYWLWAKLCLQDEVQYVAWTGVNQVTIHPCVMYYHCPDDNDIVSEEIVFLSSDMVHGSHAVRHFTKKSLQYLRDVRGVTFTRLVQISDGCSSQYKSHKTFEDITEIEEVAVERIFYGSRHGKSSSDRVTAHVKSAVRRAVRAQQAVINNAQEMFTYCQKWQETQSLMTNVTTRG